MTLLVMVAPILLAAVVMLFRRLRTITSLIAVAALAAEAAALIRLAPLPSMSVFGRVFELGLTARYAMIWCAGVSLVIELVAWWVGDAEELAPVALLTVPLIGVAFGFRITSFTAMSLQIVALLAVVLVQGNHTGDAVGALRMLTLTLIGLPALLVAGWMLERSSLAMGTPVAWGAISVAVLVAVVAWSGAAPFQAWAGAAGRTASPLVSAWVHSVWQPMVILVLARLLATYPELETRGAMLEQLLVVGLITVAAGLFLTVARKNLGARMGTTSLLGLGLALMVLGTGTTRALPVALAVLAGRAVSAVLCGAGLAVIKREAGDLDSTAVGGVARKTPWAVAAAFAGALGLAGLPLGAAFGAGWAGYRLLTAHSTWPAIVCAVASMGVAVGWWQGLRWLSLPGTGDRPRQPPALVAILLMLIIGGLMLAVWPQPLLDAGQLMARAVEGAIR